MRTAAVAGFAFLLTFLVRTSNFETAFAGGVPQLSPYDELYHAKRLVHSAQRPLRVLDFDPMRGIGGAFCPWPPLYDLAGGLAARALGARSAIDVVARASWFPPIVSALVAALVAALLARRLSVTAGLLAGAGIALATFYVDRSRLAAIDHHFLEFPLILAILGATLLVARAESSREALRSGALLGLALAAAVLVQTALLLAAALVLAVVLLLPSAGAGVRRAAAAGFLLASAVVVVYRATKPAGYPDDEWHLGFPHAAALFAAGAACLCQYLLLRRGAPRVSSAILAALAGGVVLAAIPGALEAFLEGSRFLGGNPWLESILEFQPLFRQPNVPFAVDFGLLGGGVLVTAAAGLTSRDWRSGTRAILLSFAIAYAIAGVTSRRFLATSGPLAAVTGAIAVADFARERRRALAVVAGVVLLAPSAWLTVGQIRRPPSPVTRDMVPALRAAEYLRGRTDAPGRVLAPWSFGHLFNVVGGRGVVVDNFGTAGGRLRFENALAIALATREDRVADFCGARGVRFVVLQDPLPYYADHAGMSGLPRPAFQAIDGSGERRPTRLMTATFWWRAFFEGGRERPDLGAPGPPFRRFRHVRTEISPERSEVRSAVQVWELVDPSGVRP